MLRVQTARAAGQSVTQWACTYVLEGGEDEEENPAPTATLPTSGALLARPVTFKSTRVFYFLLFFSF